MISVTPGLNFTQKIFVEKHVQLHKQAVEKFDLNISVNSGLR